jgi:hypothetical protein
MKCGKVNPAYLVLMRMEAFFAQQIVGLAGGQLGFTYVPEVPTPCWTTYYAKLFKVALPTGVPSSMH